MTIEEAIRILINFRERKDYIYTSEVNQAFDLVIETAINTIA